MAPKFIRVRKDNKTRDRGFIAVDAICSVFENKETHNVSIMTMDGFWYDVVDDIEELYTIVTDNSLTNSSGRKSNNPARKDFYKHRKMLPPVTGEEKPPQKHGPSKIGVEIQDGCDIFKFSKGKRDSNRSKNLSAGADEGHRDANSKTVQPLAEGVL